MINFKTRVANFDVHRGILLIEVVVVFMVVARSVKFVCNQACAISVSTVCHV